LIIKDKRFGSLSGGQILGGGRSRMHANWSKTLFNMDIPSQNSQRLTAQDSMAALILAGGHSSRMGRDKALVLWEGVPLLGRVGEVAARCCPQVYVLAPRGKGYRERFGDRYFFLEESNPGQGPLAALTEALTQLPLENSAIAWILLLACDLPQLNPHTLQRWSARLPQLPPTTLAFVPRRNDRWEPLCGFYRTTALSSLSNFMQQGGRSFQVWLSQVRAEALSVTEEEAEMLLNCNRPEDLSPE
jgi:molybdopterin-guanine dinucleotide biosynthesis protein A